MSGLNMNRSKMGLSSIMGAIFLVLVMIAGFNMITWGIQQQDGYSLSLLDRSTEDWNRISEEAEITSAIIDQGKFNISIQNKGSLAAHIVRLWVTNETANPQWHQKYDIDYYVNPGETIYNVGQTLPLYAVNSSGYTLTVITERGNSETFRILPSSMSPPRIVMNVPVNIMQANLPVTAANIKVLMFVTNNNTNVDAIRNVVPQLDMIYRDCRIDIHCRGV